MFEQLNNRFARIVKNIKGQGKISESNVSDTLRDIRIALLEADVSLSVVKKFVDTNSSVNYIDFLFGTAKECIRLASYENAWAKINYNKLFNWWASKLFLYNDSTPS